jgi:glyoxylase-like metal-dependent hydrolase (beta-lactamase superfamily II)
MLVGDIGIAALSDGESIVPGDFFRATDGHHADAVGKDGRIRLAIAAFLPTHLHADHAGWMFPEGKFYFPNAIIRFGAREWDRQRRVRKKARISATRASGSSIGPK